MLEEYYWLYLKICDSLVFMLILDLNLLLLEAEYEVASLFVVGHLPTILAPSCYAPAP